MSKVTIKRESKPGRMRSAQVASNIGGMPILVRAECLESSHIRVTAQKGDQWFYKTEIQEWAKALLEMCSE